MLTGRGEAYAQFVCTESASASNRLSRIIGGLILRGRSVGRSDAPHVGRRSARSGAVQAGRAAATTVVGASRRRGRGRHFGRGGGDWLPGRRSDDASRAVAAYLRAGSSVTRRAKWHARGLPRPQRRGPRSRARRIGRGALASDDRRVGTRPGGGARLARNGVRPGRGVRLGLGISGQRHGMPSGSVAANR